MASCPTWRRPNLAPSQIWCLPNLASSYIWCRPPKFGVVVLLPPLSFHLPNLVSSQLGIVPLVVVFPSSLCLPNLPSSSQLGVVPNLTSSSNLASSHLASSSQVGLIFLLPPRPRHSLASRAPNLASSCSTMCRSLPIPVSVMFLYPNLTSSHPVTSRRSVMSLSLDPCPALSVQAEPSSCKPA